MMIMHIFASSKRISDKGNTITTEYNIDCADVVKVTIGLPGNRIQVVEFKDGVEPMATISDELLQRIVSSAFKAGWARGLVWRPGDELVTPPRFAAVIRNARKVVKRSNNKKG
jgi:hypothetical protein